MSWVNIGVAAVGVVGSYVNGKKAKGGGGGGGGDAGAGIRTASEATYGTTTNADAWIINFGDGATQSNTPTLTTTSSYPQQENPLNALQPVTVLANPAPAGFELSQEETWVLLGVAGIVAVKMLRR